MGHNRGRFTLVELMIVVAIISILAAIAIPNFAAMQMRARRAELPVNADGIHSAIVACASTDDSASCTAAWAPSPTTFGKQLQEWTTSAAWDEIGFKPDGDVRGCYAGGYNLQGTMGMAFAIPAGVTTPNASAVCNAYSICAIGISDLDENDQAAVYRVSSGAVAESEFGDQSVY